MPTEPRWYMDKMREEANREILEDYPPPHPRHGDRTFGSDGKEYIYCGICRRRHEVDPLNRKDSENE